MLSAFHCVTPGLLGSPDAGKKWGKERFLLRTTISDQQSAPGSWRRAHGIHSLLPEPGERMRIQAEGPGRGPEPLSTSLPPGKGGAVPPRVCVGGHLVVWTTVELGMGGYWPSCCATPSPASLPGRVGPAGRGAACVPATGTRAGGRLSRHLQPHPFPCAR